MGIWYVEFPTYRYNEDVRALAKAAGLKILDKRFMPDDADQPDNAPELTLRKPGAAPAKAQSADTSETDEAEAAARQQRIGLLVDYMVQEEMTAKPPVKPTEKALSIDTNGKEIAEAWQLYQYAKEQVESDDGGEGNDDANEGDAE